MSDEQAKKAEEIQSSTQEKTESLSDRLKRQREENLDKKAKAASAGRATVINKPPVSSLAELGEEYAKDEVSLAQRNKRNFILMGRAGTGKTTMAFTGKRPAIAHSFDPGDLESVQDGIDDGWIIANSRWEAEDYEKTWAFDDWVSEMARLEKSGIFNEVGTFVLASLTGLCRAGANKILKAHKDVGGTLKWERDYQDLQNLIELRLRDLCKLPCDVVLLAHCKEPEKDEMSGRSYGAPLAPGRGNRDIIPTLFSEIYYLETKGGYKIDPNDPTGKRKLSTTIYQCYTQPQGVYDARTRMGRNGRLSRIEEPNIEYLYKKCGLPFSHKPGWEPK